MTKLLCTSGDGSDRAEQLSHLAADKGTPHSAYAQNANLARSQLNSGVRRSGGNKRARKIGTLVPSTID